MPTSFAAKARVALLRAHDVFGQEVVFTPMTPAADPNAAAVPDTARNCGRLRAVFFDPRQRTIIPNGYDPRADLRPGAATGDPRFEFFPDEDFQGVKLGDIVTQLNGPGGTEGARWRVTSVFVKPHGVVVANVNSL